MNLFERVISECGIAPIFAENAVRRAFARAGVPTERLTRAALVRVLPSLRQTLATYLMPREVEERMEVLERLTRSSSGLVKIDLAAEHLDDLPTARSKPKRGPP